MCGNIQRIMEFLIIVGKRGHKEIRIPKKYSICSHHTGKNAQQRDENCLFMFEQTNGLNYERRNVSKAFIEVDRHESRY